MMARSISTGNGIPRHAGFPPGLPGLYAFVDVLGAGRSWAIVTLNVVFAVVAVGCTIFLYRRVLGISAQASIFLGCAGLLSHVVVKHGAMAMSDVPFLGMSSAALALLTAGARGRAGREWASGLGSPLPPSRSAPPASRSFPPRSWPSQSVRGPQRRHELGSARRWPRPPSRASAPQAWGLRSSSRARAT
jgi:hypothetical protein